MAYYHSKGAAKQLRSKMDRDKQIIEQIHNLSVQRRYSSDEERREIDQRILELKRQLK